MSRDSVNDTWSFPSIKHNNGPGVMKKESYVIILPISCQLLIDEVSVGTCSYFLVLFLITLLLAAFTSSIYI
jgi:hypothetical protein